MVKSREFVGNGLGRVAGNMARGFEVTGVRRKDVWGASRRISRWLELIGE